MDDGCGTKTVVVEFPKPSSMPIFDVDGTRLNGLKFENPVDDALNYGELNWKAAATRVACFDALEQFYQELRTGEYVHRERPVGIDVIYRGSRGSSLKQVSLEHVIEFPRFLDFAILGIKTPWLDFGLFTFEKCWTPEKGYIGARTDNPEIAPPLSRLIRATTEGTAPVESIESYLRSLFH